MKKYVVWMVMTAFAVRGQAPAKSGPLSDEELTKQLKAELDKRTSEDRFSGTVMIAKNGKPIFSYAGGMADRDKKTPMDMDSLLRIGSMNKMFTGVAVTQLAQKGKLSFDDKIEKFLPDYPNKDVASKVTVHHLLTHTGGTGDFFGPEYREHRLELKELKDYVGLFGKRGLAFEPGSRFAYSNYGFLLLGLIIEKASGQSYYDYVQEHIFKPAGMTRTNSLPEIENVPGRTTGYMRRDGKWQPNTDTLPYRGTSAGGGYSTSGDLVRFANALLSHKLLDEKHTRLATTGKVEMGPLRRYGYGFGQEEDGSFGHNGGAPGMNGDLRIIPSKGYVIAALSNFDPPAASDIASWIAVRLSSK